MMGEKQPSGFDENPTRWSRRIPIVALACAGLCVLLILMQAFLVGAWCTLCLVSADISIAIFILGFREPLAGLHYLAWVRGSGGSAWRALWGMSAGESARG